MISVFDAASYVYNRYQKEYEKEIDEMKLHKLLYFAQRESIIQTGEPMFEATFYGWKFGPVLKEIRGAYKNHSFSKNICLNEVKKIKPIMDRVFEDYADKGSWSLSRLTHGEFSWKNSRKEVSEYENSDNPMSISDIEIDAKRIKERRQMLEML